MDSLSDTLYYALQGFETQQAMQYNRCMGLPCRQIVRTGVEVAQVMLGDELIEEHRQTYLNLIHRRLYDRRETVMTVIVMAALFSLIRNDRQASRCRAALIEDWGDEIYDIYQSYSLAVDEQIDCEIAKQQSQTYTISVMKTDQPQTVINVAGNYIAQQNIDIHDNENCNIYACPQPEAQNAQPTEQGAERGIPIPRKGDYNSVREYVEERKKCDEVFLQYSRTHTRKQLCDRLTDEFGWVVDVNSYGKNLARNL